MHGPLQAILLLNFASVVRSLSPLFDDDRVRLHAREDGEELKLWTTRENGSVAVTAVARWS